MDRKINSYKDIFFFFWFEETEELRFESYYIVCKYLVISSFSDIYFFPFLRILHFYACSTRSTRHSKNYVLFQRFPGCVPTFLKKPKQKIVYKFETINFQPSRCYEPFLCSWCIFLIPTLTYKFTQKRSSKTSNSVTSCRNLLEHQAQNFTREATKPDSQWFRFFLSLSLSLSLHWTQNNSRGGNTTMRVLYIFQTMEERS